jgi:hypothetical protein
MSFEIYKDKLKDLFATYPYIENIASKRIGKYILFPKLEEEKVTDEYLDNYKSYLSVSNSYIDSDTTSDLNILIEK